MTTWHDENDPNAEHEHEHEDSGGGDDDGNDNEVEVEVLGEEVDAGVPDGHVLAVVEIKTLTNQSVLNGRNDRLNKYNVAPRKKFAVDAKHDDDAFFRVLVPVASYRAQLKHHCATIGTHTHRTRCT